MPTITGQRVRSNNAYGVTTDNPLTAGATTFNSTQLTLLPNIAAGQHTVIVLDPKRVFGQPEIVIVTAHVGLSTTATITRAAYGTTAISHAVGTAWAHVAVNEDFIQVLSSTTRPTDPYMGQAIYETDTISAKYYNGTVWNSDPPIGTILAYAGSTAPTGYLLANGAEASRTGVTADLFALISTTYGAGNGSTTFNLPNLLGRVPVGRDAAQAEFDVLGETGGEKTHVLTTGELATHLHGTSESAHNHTQNSHNHTQDAHSHDDGSYGTGGESGHTHHSPGNNFVFERGLVESQRIPDAGSTTNGVYVTFSPNTLGSSGHTHDVQGSSGSFTATNQATTATNNPASTGLTTTNTGSGTAHNNLQPYIAINYIIKI